MCSRLRPGAGRGRIRLAYPNSACAAAYDPVPGVVGFVWLTPILHVQPPEWRKCYYLKYLLFRPAYNLVGSTGFRVEGRVPD